MKKLLALLLLLVLCVSIAIPSIGTTYDKYSDPTLLVDLAELLTDKEEKSVLMKLKDISERQAVNVAVAALPYKMDADGNSIEMDIEEYANQFFDTYGYGYGNTDDGILLLIDMDEREWAIVAVGYGNVAVTDAAYDMLENEIIPYLSGGEYVEAFTRYAEICDELISYADDGTPYGSLGSPTSASWLLICLLIGFVIAIIAVGVMISKMKTVQNKYAANEYIKDGSFNLTNRQDIYLYSRLIKNPRESSSGGRSGSSGGRSGGGGRSSRGGRF